MLIESKIYLVTNTGVLDDYLYFMPFSLFPMNRAQLSKFTPLIPNVTPTSNEIFTEVGLRNTGYTCFYEPDFDLHQDWGESTLYDYRLMNWSKEMSLIVLSEVWVDSLKPGVNIFAPPYLFGNILTRTIVKEGDNFIKTEFRVMAKNYPHILEF